MKRKVYTHPQAATIKALRSIVDTYGSERDRVMLYSTCYRVLVALGLTSNAAHKATEAILAKEWNWEDTK